MMNMVYVHQLQVYSKMRASGSVTMPDADIGCTDIIKYDTSHCF